MSWMFVADIVFYSLLGIFIFPLVVLIVAQLGNDSFRNGYRTVKDFLTKWAAIPGKDLVDVVLKVSGISTVVLLLGFGAYLANRIGDAALPQGASLFGYFGSAEVRWSLECEKEWDLVIFNLREVTGIRGDRVKWEEAKVAMGRYDVRFFRAGAVIFFALMISSLIAWIAWRRLKYGIAFLVACLLAVTCNWLWVDREEKYMANVIGRYISEHMMKHKDPPQRPDNYPGIWHGESRGQSVPCGVQGN